MITDVVIGIFVADLIKTVLAMILVAASKGSSNGQTK